MSRENERTISPTQAETRERGLALARLIPEDHLLPGRIWHFGLPEVKQAVIITLGWLTSPENPFQSTSVEALFAYLFRLKPVYTEGKINELVPVENPPKSLDKTASMFGIVKSTLFGNFEQLKRFCRRHNPETGTTLTDALLPAVPAGNYRVSQTPEFGLTFSPDKKPWDKPILTKREMFSSVSASKHDFLPLGSLNKEITGSRGNSAILADKLKAAGISVFTYQNKGKYNQLYYFIARENQQKAAVVLVENSKSPADCLLSLLPVGHKFDSTPFFSLLGRIGIEIATENEITVIAKKTLRLLLNTSSDGRLFVEPEKAAIIKYLFGLNPEISLDTGRITQLKPMEWPNRAPGLEKLTRETGCRLKTLRNTVYYFLTRNLISVAKSIENKRPSERETLPVTALQGGIFRVTEEHQIIIVRQDKKAKTP